MHNGPDGLLKENRSQIVVEGAVKVDFSRCNAWLVLDSASCSCRWKHFQDQAVESSIGFEHGRNAFGGSPGSSI